MPTYDYLCQACGNEFEKFESIVSKPSRKCPDCGKIKLKRLIGPGAGIIFKGSGFYQTDYRSESYTKAAKSEKNAKSAAAETNKPQKAEKTGKNKDVKNTGDSAKTNKSS